MELFNYKGNCRLCLKTHTDFMKNIFTHSIEGCRESLVENIFSLFRIELSPHEDYPQFICRKCLTELENILLLKEDLQRTQDFLLDLFTAAYPNYVEKKTNLLRNLHTLNLSVNSGLEVKSVAVNTETTVDLKNLGDSEYISVPVTFLKQFSPQVCLDRTENRTLVNAPPELKEEIIIHDVLIGKKEPSLNICKYCSKIFRSEALVETHCKKFHHLDELHKKNVTRKRISNRVQKSLAKKIKTDENRNFSLSNLPELPTEQITIPQIDLQNNNNAVLKAELDFGSTDQQVSDNKPTEPIFQENQASFLQNFNLIAKREAALIKTQQETPSRTLPKRRNLKKQIVPRSIKTTIVKPLKTENNKNKVVVKPSAPYPKKRRSPKINEQHTLSRSLQFLKRYGWRKLNSSSRRGTIINTDKFSSRKGTIINNDPRFNLLHNKIARKPLPKQDGFTKNSTKNNALKDKLSVKCKGIDSKTVLKEEGCESAHNLGNMDQDQDSELSDVKVKRSNSIASFDNKNLKEIATYTTNTTNRNSATFTPNSKSSKISIENIKILKESPTTKCESYVKCETSPASSNEKNDKDYKVISSKLFYKSESDIPKEPMGNKKLILEKPNRSPYDDDEQHLTTNRTLNDLKTDDNSLMNQGLKGLVSWESSEHLKDPRNAHTILNNHGSKTSGFHEPPKQHNKIGLKLKLIRSGSTDSFTGSETESGEKVWRCRRSLKKTVFDSSSSSNELEAKKELRVQLERHRSTKKQINKSSIDFTFGNHHSNVSNKKHDVPKLDTLIKRDVTKLPKKGGRQKNNNDDAFSETNNSSSLKKRGRPLKKQNLEDMSLSSDIECNLVSKNKSTLLSINKITNFNDSSIKSPIADTNLKAVVPKKRGRPRKHKGLNNSLLSTSRNTPSSSSADPSVPTSTDILNCESLLDVTRNKLDYIPVSNILNVKNEELSTLQDLNDRYEIDENIGLRIKLRRTVSCESLNSLKYDTQEFDERLQLKGEILDTNSNINFSDELDNKKLLMSVVKEEGPIPEKVVNVDLEDEEIQMLVLLSDDEGVSFDDDDISKYVKTKRSSLNLKECNLLSLPKSCLSLEGNGGFSLNDSATKQNSFIIRSQSSLPLKKNMLNEFDSDLAGKFLRRSKSPLSMQEDVSSLFISNRLRASSSVGLDGDNDRPAKRRGRPPTKFSPSMCLTNRSTSTAKLLKKKLNDRMIETKPEKCSTTRSGSTSQKNVNNNGNELVKEVKKRGRPSKAEKIKNVSTLVEKNSAPNKSDKNPQQKNTDARRQSVPNPVSLRKLGLDPSPRIHVSGLDKIGTLVEKNTFNSKPVHVNKLNMQKRKERGFEQNKNHK